MFRASSSAAIIEVSVLALLAILLMAMDGTASGVILALIPIGWILATIRIYFTLKLCSGISGRTLRFVACGFVGCCCAYLLTWYFSERAPGNETAVLALVMGASSMFAGSKWQNKLGKDEVQCSNCGRVISLQAQRCPWCYKLASADASTSETGNG